MLIHHVLPNLLAHDLIELSKLKALILKQIMSSSLKLNKKQLKIAKSKFLSLFKILNCDSY